MRLTRRGKRRLILLLAILFMVLNPMREMLETQDDRLQRIEQKIDELSK